MFACSHHVQVEETVTRGRAGPKWADVAAALRVPAGKTADLRSKYRNLVLPCLGPG